MIYIKTNEILKEFFKFLKENNAYIQYRTNICYGFGIHPSKKNINSKLETFQRFFLVLFFFFILHHLS